MNVKLPHPSIIALGIAVMSAIVFVYRVSQFTPGPFHGSPFGGPLAESGAAVDQYLSQWGPIDQALVLLATVGFTLFFVLIRLPLKKLNLISDLFLPVPRFPPIGITVTSVMAIVSGVGMLQKSIEVHELGTQASIVMQDLDKSIINEDTVGGVFGTALAVVSRNPKDAVVSVLSLSYSVWDHFSHGREARQQLSAINIELSSALWWRRIFLYLGSGSAMFIFVKILYSGPYREA